MAGTRISYPFAAIPHQVLRGGYGAINIAVLAALLSHGKTTASVNTLAEEIGCDPKSVRAGIAFWEREGERNGIKLTKQDRPGFTQIIEIEITEMTVDKRGDTPTENGRGVLPKTAGVPLPKTVDKVEPLEEDPIRKPPYPPVVVEKINKTNPKKPYLEGDPAYQMADGSWRVRIHTGEFVDYTGSVKNNLVWK